VAIAADGSAALSLPDPTSVLRQDNQKDSGGGDKSAMRAEPKKTVDEPTSHSFESVEQLIENAGKLERLKKAVRQGWIKGDSKIIFKNLAEKYGVEIEQNAQGIQNFKLNDLTVHLTGSGDGIPTLRIKYLGHLFKIRII